VAGAVVWAHTLAASLASVAVIAAALAGLAVTVSAVGALSIVVGSDTGLVVPARVGLGGLVGRSINPCFSIWADAVAAGESLPVGVAVAEVVLAADTVAVAVGGA